MDAMTQNWLWFALAFVVAGHVLLRLRHQARGDNDPGKDAHHDSRGGGGDQCAQVSQTSQTPDSVIDPVTGKPVSTDDAPAFFYQGRVYFFASAGSRELFVGAPEGYLRRGTVGRENALLKADRPPRCKPARTSAGPLGGTTLDEGGAGRPDQPGGRIRDA